MSNSKSESRYDAAAVIGSRNYPIRPPGKGTDSVSDIEPYIQHVQGTALLVPEKSDSGSSISLLCGGKYEAVYTVKATTIRLVDELKPGIKLDLIVEQGATAHALAILSPRQYALFQSWAMPKDKLSAISFFHGLSKAEQEELLAQHDEEQHPILELVEERESTRLLKLTKRYRMVQGCSTPAQQSAINELIRTCKTDGYSSRSNSRMIKRLELLIHIAGRPGRPGPPLLYDEVLEKLNESFYAQSKAKQAAADLLSARGAGGTAFSLLIVGPRGSGKHRLAQLLAGILGQPHETIPLSGMKCAIDVNGLDPSYEGSAPGPIAEAFFTARTTAMTLILPGFDKMDPGGWEGDPYRSISAPITEHELRDRFLDVSVPLKHTHFIALAECTDTIPDYLLEGFHVIRLDPYSLEEKMTIAQDYVLPDLLDKLGMPPGSAVIQQNALEHLVRDYTNDLGLNCIARNLETCLRALLRKYPSASAGHPVTISRSLVPELLSDSISTDDPLVRYNRFHHLYSDQVHREIQRICGELSNDHLDPHRRDVQKRRLNALTALVSDPKALRSFSAESFRADLDRVHYGQNEAKDAVVSALNAYAQSGKPVSGVRFMMAGPAGSGKTSLGKAIADSLHATFVKISLNGVEDPRQIKGFPEVDTGLIVQRLANEAEQRPVVVLLDEVDKAGCAVQQALIDVMDDSHEMLDALLGIPVDLSFVMFLATCNDPSAVHPILLDRFDLISVPGYTLAEKRQITRSHVLPELRAQLGRPIELTPDAEELLLLEYCTSVGLRDVKKALSRAAKQQLLHSSAKRVRISAKTLRRALGGVIPRGNIPTVTPPGLANALAVSGSHGLAFAVEAVLTQEQETIITGLPMEAVIESVKEARTALNQLYPKHRIGKGIHLKFGEGGVKKDGPSAGLAIFMALYSAAAGVAVPRDMAFTGEIDLFGNIFPVGGIAEKVHGAYLAGCKTVLIPSENSEEIYRRGLDQYPLTIVPVDHVELAVLMLKTETQETLITPYQLLEQLEPDNERRFYYESEV